MSTTPEVTLTTVDVLPESAQEMAAEIIAFLAQCDKELSEPIKEQAITR